MNAERDGLRRAGRLNALHWAVVAISLGVTMLAFVLSSSALDARIEADFERRADRVLTQIAERMKSYEDALWAGVAAIDANGGDMPYAQWKRFAASLDIGSKYQGINGIGVIYAVGEAELDAHVARQRGARPDFSVYPQHAQPDKLVITYIEPVEANRNAVGLDVAHEANRLAAALAARDTDAAQITGPITLVQDAERTPGFLFYAPFYAADVDGVVARREAFTGLVYAPFIVHKLMRGTLARSQRQVGIRIRDAETLLYDEHHAGEADYDADALHERSDELALYGRRWEVTLRSTKAFRDSHSHAQPWIILAGGIFIDLLLLLLFAQLARANRRALSFATRFATGYADKAERLELAVAKLEASNDELAQFAHVASHDLQEPLRTLNSFAELLQRELEGDPRDIVHTSLGFIARSAGRMRRLVQALLDFSRLGHERLREQVDTAALIDDVLEDLKGAIAGCGATVTVAELPSVRGYPTELRLLFQNLISNAIKFRTPGHAPRVDVDYERVADGHRFTVRDDGIGIDRHHLENIFGIFQRLHRRDDYEGTGIGLAHCRKIVARHRGEITVESTPGEGSAFIVTLPASGEPEASPAI